MSKLLNGSNGGSPFELGLPQLRVRSTVCVTIFVVFFLNILSVQQSVIKDKCMVSPTFVVLENVYYGNEICFLK